MKTNMEFLIRPSTRRRSSRRALFALLTFVLLLGSIPPATATMQGADTTAESLALAMGVPADDLVSADLMGSDPNGVAVIETALGTAGFPTEGSSFAILSTGTAANASQPNNEDNLSEALEGIDNSQGNDLVQLHLALNVPNNINCLGFDFAYCRL